jgi:hypothetical protein
MSCPKRVARNPCIRGSPGLTWAQASCARLKLVRALCLHWAVPAAISAELEKQKTVACNGGAPQGEDARPGQVGGGRRPKGHNMAPYRGLERPLSKPGVVR